MNNTNLWMNFVGRERAMGGRFHTLFQIKEKQFC